MLSTSSISRAGGDLSYLALGDSYSIGEAVPEHARWPVQLAQQLRADGIGLAPPRIIATTGWTTDELSAAMDAAEPLGEWDFVSLLIGVNNQYRGRSTGTSARSSAPCWSAPSASPGIARNTCWCSPSPIGA